MISTTVEQCFPLLPLRGGPLGPRLSGIPLCC